MCQQLQLQPLTTKQASSTNHLAHILSRGTQLTEQEMQLMAQTEAPVAQALVGTSMHMPGATGGQHMPGHGSQVPRN
jgi:hypothetical protein